MNYTLNQLNIFLKIVQNKSVTLAAEELNLTQPAVSIQLKNFQDQFDVPLTEIIGRKIYITDFGFEIANAAESILNQVNAINYKTLLHKGILAGRLKFSIVSTAKYVLPYFLKNFIKENKEVELLIDVTNKSKVIRSLENNEIDFALVSILPTSLNIDKLDLLKNKLYLIGASDSTFDLNNINKENLKNLPLIFREKGSGTRQVMENFINDNSITVHKKMTLTSNEAVKQAILAGLGFSIMPVIGIKNELQNNELKIIEIQGLPIITTWSLIWLKSKKLTPVSEAFLNFLKTHKNEIIKTNFEW